MSDNDDINGLLKKKELYQKFYDEATNTDLSFANDDKKFQVESTKRLYAQRIAKVEKELENLNYMEVAEQIQSQAHNKFVEKPIKNNNIDESIARELLKVKNAIKKWYKERAHSYSGSFGGICDDCSINLKKTDMYLTGGMYGICETCLESRLSNSYKWEEYIHDLQSAIGSTSAQVPYNILQIASETAKKINDLKKKSIIKKYL